MSTKSLATAAVRRSDQKYYDLLSQREALDFGYAYFSSDFPELPACNFVGEVSLQHATDDPVAAVNAFFERRDLTCLRWVPAADADAEEVAALLAARNFERRQQTTLLLAQARPPEPAVGPFRIISARAMRRAFTQIMDQRHEEHPESTGELTRAQLERLNEPQFEAFVAMEGEEPCGTITIHQVGEIGRVRDIYVRPDRRRRGVGAALMHFAIQTAQRWSLNPICTAVCSENAMGRALLLREGFVEDGTIVSFSRPGTGRVCE